MFSENNRISGKQLGKMLLFDLVSITILTIPGLSANRAGRDGILAAAAGSLAAVLYAGFFLFVSKRTKGDYVENMGKVFGTFFGSLIGMLYVVKMLISCWFTIALFCGVIAETILPDTQFPYIAAAFILVGAYMAAKGIEVRARVVETIFFLIAVPLFLVFLFGLKRIEPVNLFPFFMTDKKDVVQAGYTVLLLFSSLECLVFALPYVKSGKDREGGHKKGIFLAVILAAALNCVLLVLIIGMLGVEEAGRQFDSTITILQVVELPIGFMKRLDAVILLFWLVMAFTAVSGYFYYLSHSTGRIFRVKSRYGCLLFYGLLLFLLCMVRLTPERLIGSYVNYMAYIGFPQSILLPLLLLAVKKIRKIE